MTPERWRRIEQVYHDAYECPASDRAAFLARACGEDLDLRREVEQLLARESSTAAGFLSEPVVAVPMQPKTLGSDADPSSSQSSWLVGRQLGVYSVSARLGAGGMGEVYRARDTRLGRDVAIKILPRELTADPERLGRLTRDARILASLNHPHIGAIYGLEQGVPHGPRDDPHSSDEVRALVLELVEGETLAERIARGPLPHHEAVDTARQIADALATAHDKGIVHRVQKTEGGVPASPDRRSGGRHPANLLTRRGSVQALASAGASAPPEPGQSHDRSRGGWVRRN